MAKTKKQAVPKKNQENGLLKRVEGIESGMKNFEVRMKTLETSMQKALDTLSQGIADNIGQMWDNQKELSAALSEMSESTAKAIEEVRSAQR